GGGPARVPGAIHPDHHPSEEGSPGHRRPYRIPCGRGLAASTAIRRRASRRVIAAAAPRRLVFLFFPVLFRMPITPSKWPRPPSGLATRPRTCRGHRAISATQVPARFANAHGSLRASVGRWSGEQPPHWGASATGLEAV